MERVGHEITLENLKEMSEVDVHTVDKNTLVDVADVHIRTDLPKEERMIDYIRQIKNPYCYLSNGIVVKISFAGKDTLEQCLSRCIAPEKKM